MNAQTLAKMAYSAPGQPTQTPRSTEYELFSRITRRLRAASAKFPVDFPALVEALHDNRKLWNALAVDVADASNGLPKELRAQIFYLAEFTNHHTRKVLSDKASADVLIEINTTIMRGLKSGGGQ